jgi:hypothetical protein
MCDRSVTGYLVEDTIMLEVQSHGITEGTGHDRMVVYSTLTKCELSLVETEDGILSYKKCPKKLTEKELIQKLKWIREKHLRITNRENFQWGDVVCDDIDKLIEEIPKMWSDHSESVSLDGVGSLVGELDGKNRL